MQPARGYIALMAAIIISSILLGAGASLSQDTFFTRFDVLNREFKKVADGYARSCLQIAYLKLADDYHYTVQSDPDYDSERGGVPITVAHERDCLLLAPTTTPQMIDHTYRFPLEAVGTYHNAYSTLHATAIVRDPSYSPGTSDDPISLTDFYETP